MTSSISLINKQERRFRRLAFLTIIVIYLLILAGGIVRGTGSGMGCPDWPTCFGRWIPPTEASQLPPNYQKIYGAKLKDEVEFNATKTWIEYANRLLGVLSGFLVFAVLVSSIPFLRKDNAIFWGSVSAFLLIGANGWLGSRVVATELAQYMITLHLLLAIAVVFTLLFVWIRSNASYVVSERPSVKTTTLSGFLFVVILVTLGQIILGTQVRDALDEVVKQTGYAQRASWISNLKGSFYIHRSFSLVVLALHLTIIYRLRKLPKTDWLARLTTGLVVVVIIEISMGVVMAYFGVPAVAQPIHLVLAIVMIGLQFVVWLIINPKLVVSQYTKKSLQFVNA